MKKLIFTLLILNLLFISNISQSSTPLAMTTDTSGRWVSFCLGGTYLDATGKTASQTCRCPDGSNATSVAGYTYTGSFKPPYYGANFDSCIKDIQLAK